MAETEGATPAPKKPAAKKPAAAKAPAAPKKEPKMITVRATQRGFKEHLIEPGEVFQHPEDRFSEHWMEKVELDDQLEPDTEE